MARWLGVFALTLMVLALAAGPASAKTFVVDDDKAECPNAQFRHVQPAVGAADRNDAIRVCDGTYREQVVIPVAKRGLELSSVNPQGAVLMSPPAGMTVRHLVPLAIVVIRAKFVRFRGFRVQGPLKLVDPGQCDDQLHPAGIAVPQGSARIAGTVIDGTVVPQCFDGIVVGSGVHTGAVNEPFCCEGGVRFERVVVDHTQIRRTRSGVTTEDGGALEITNSLLQGLGRRDFGDGLEVVPVRSRAAAIRVENNLVSSYNIGVTLGCCGEIGARVVGNRIEDSRIGIVLGDSHGVVRANRLFRNGDGIWSFENAIADFDVINNTIRDSESLGLRMEGSDTTLRDNTSLRSGELDCFDSDDSNENTWINNVGATAQPREICRAPRG
jgi:hypothetical protein